MRKIGFFIKFILFFILIDEYAYTQTASLKEIKEIAKNCYWEQSGTNRVKIDYNTISPDIAFTKSKNSNTIYLCCGFT